MFLDGFEVISGDIYIGLCLETQKRPVTAIELHKKSLDNQKKLQSGFCRDFKRKRAISEKNNSICGGLTGQFHRQHIKVNMVRYPTPERALESQKDTKLLFLMHFQKSN